MCWATIFLQEEAGIRKAERVKSVALQGRSELGRARQGRKIFQQKNTFDPHQQMRVRAGVEKKSTQRREFYS